jgi:hypothetical protein
MRRRPTTKLRFAVCVVATACVSLPAACNIFLGLGRCDSSSDCPNPSKDICDPEAKICVRRTTADGSGGGGDGGDGTAPGVPDADAEPGTPACDINAPFGDLRLVPGLESLAVTSARFSSDENKVYYSRLNGCALESCVDLFVAERQGGVFRELGQIYDVNSPVTSDYWPTITGDGKLLYFESSRTLEQAPAQARIWRAIFNETVREYKDLDLPPLFRAVDSGNEISPYVQPDGLSVYFSSTARGGAGNFDIFVAELNPDGLGNPKAIRNIIAINTPRAELHPVATKDDRALYFAREDETTTIRDIYVSKRADADASTPFEPAVPVNELNTPSEDFPCWISIDQCRIYFTSDRVVGDAGVGGVGAHLWMASRSKLSR